MAALHVRLLGSLQVERGGDVVRIGPPRVREVFAYLLLEGHDPLPRGHLAYTLWPDSSERQARTNLRQALHQLRRALPETERLLMLDGPHVGWRADGAFEFDVATFEQQLAIATTARQTDDLALEARALALATKVYQGDLLPEVYAGWIEPHRLRLRDACAHALERLAAVLVGQRDDRGAIDIVSRLVRHDPLAEAPYRLLMQLLDRTGERAKALHVYHTCATVLQRDLGVDPAPATRALHQQLLGRNVAVADDDPAPAVATTSAHAVPLVGRTVELRALREAWRAAVDGRPRLMLLTGDAGIGKTRLAEEFARSVPAREGVVASARCYAAEGALAYAPVAALLRAETLRSAVAGLAPAWRREVARLLPELQVDELPPAPEAMRRTRMFDAVARAFAAAQPLLLVLDDLHWCDPDTLAWLHYLLRFDPRARLLVVATVREHELGPEDVLQTWLAAARDEDLLLTTDVPPLLREETEALAGGLGHHDLSPTQLGRLHAESEGNPLFVIELVRTGLGSSAADAAAGAGEAASSLPPRLRAVIGARLERLSPATVELTGVASVIGREFDVELLLRVSRCDEDTAVGSLDELWRRRVVRELSAGQYDFTHDKLREVAYQSLSLTRRRLLHRYVAEALEVLHGDAADEASGRIAVHYDHAGLSERAVARYVRAGDVARRRYAEEEALAHYRRGLALVDELQPSAALTDWHARVSADLHEGLAELASRRGQHDTALEGYERALAARPERDTVGRARLLRMIGRACIARYAYAEALAALAAAERTLGVLDVAGSGAGDACRERIEIGLARAGLHYWQHQWSEMERDLVAVSDLAASHASPHQLGRLYGSLAQMCFSRDRQCVSDECIELARSAHAAVARTGDVDAIANVGFLLGFTCLWRGELEEADARLRTALADAERVGSQMLRARCLTYLVFVPRLQGDVDGLRTVLAEGERVAGDLGMPEYVGAAHGQRAWLAWREGDLEACELAGRAALEAWRTGQPYPMHWVARLPLLAVAGRTARMAEAVEHASAMLDQGQQRLPGELERALTEVVSAAGDGSDPAMLRERIERVLATAQSTGRL